MCKTLRREFKYVQVNGKSVAHLPAGAVFQLLKQENYTTPPPPPIIPNHPPPLAPTLPTVPPLAASAVSLLLSQPKAAAAAPAAAPVAAAPVAAAPVALAKTNAKATAPQLPAVAHALLGAETSSSSSSSSSLSSSQPKAAPANLTTAPSVNWTWDDTRNAAFIPTPLRRLEAGVSD